MAKPIKPMLAKLAPRPIDEGYLWEEKYDGVRIVGFPDRLQARSGTDKTHIFPEIDIRTVKPCVLDGEVICSDFQAIQRRVNRKVDIKRVASEYPATYMVFDILECDGIDLRNETLLWRKRVLEEMLRPTDTVKLTPYCKKGEALFNEMLEQRKEGIVGKPVFSRYIEGQRLDWLKVKCNIQGSFVVCGYTPGTGWRKNLFGALLLAEPDLLGNLCYVGMVGTGFGNAEIESLLKSLNEIRTPVSPFGYNPLIREEVTWVQPVIWVNIRFLEYSNARMLRFPSYKGVVSCPK